MSEYRYDVIATTSIPLIAHIKHCVGNINNAINSEVILNPKTLEGLSKKETRKLERLALVAGVTLKEYVSKINFKSPEWKWL